MAGRFGDDTFGSGTFGNPTPATTPPPTGNDHLAEVNTCSRDGFMFFNQRYELDETDPDWAGMLASAWIIPVADNGVADEFVYPPVP